MEAPLRQSLRTLLSGDHVDVTHARGGGEVLGAGGGVEGSDQGRLQIVTVCKIPGLILPGHSDSECHTGLSPPLAEEPCFDLLEVTEEAEWW